jgi:hypothetical protein
MTMPEPQPFDVNNTLLGAGPARIDGGVMQTPDGRQAVFSMRTPSTTVTAILTAEDLRNWATFINALADEVDGGAKLQAASLADVAALDPTIPFRR